MASISMAQGGRSRKGLNIDIPLVPFVDLLLCCIMFLLVTAVWNQLGVIHVQQQAPGTTMDVPRNLPRIQVVLQVEQQGYVLWSTAGDRQELPGRDAHALGLLLGRRHEVDGPTQSLTVTAEDGVPYADLMAAMDLARSVGYESLEINGSLD